jgi:hypothetical protein
MYASGAGLYRENALAMGLPPGNSVSFVVLSGRRAGANNFTRSLPKLKQSKSELYAAFCVI